MNTTTAWIAVAAAVAVTAGFGTARMRDAEELHAAGVAMHLERRLTEASALYDQALALDPPRLANDREQELARRFAPRLMTTATEPFGLRDVAVVLHPTSRTIAYHLFWDDDIDFPDDNDPCDHEVVWIRHSPDGQRLEQTWTYFHDRLLTSPPADERATRPVVNVQWGKHGSLPENWRQQEITPSLSEVPDGMPVTTGPIPMTAYLEAGYRKLSTTGRRLPHNQLARRLGWPDRFTGELADFTDFRKPLDPLSRLTAPGLIIVSRFNSGPLNRWVIPYNFRPKTEWPDAR
jgi:hypothetical protein